MMKLYYCFLMAVLTACAPVGVVNVESPYRHQAIEVYGATPRQTSLIGYWASEGVASQYNNPLIVFVHGGDFMGRWVVKLEEGPVPIETFISEIRSRHPEPRWLLLIICNPGGYTLDAPGVIYATNNVWIVPDRMLTTDDAEVRDALSEETIGDLSEFTVNPMTDWSAE